MAQQVHILRLKDDDIPLSYSCIGIVTLLKPYRMAWCMNQYIHTNLILQKTLTFHESTGSAMRLFAHYLYQEAQDVYRLLHNRLERKDHTLRAFIKEWAIFDYLLLLQLAAEEKQKLMQILRNLNEIQYTQELNPDPIKNKTWLML